MVSGALSDCVVRKDAPPLLPFHEGNVMRYDGIPIRDIFKRLKIIETLICVGSPSKNSPILFSTSYYTN